MLLLAWFGGRVWQLRRMVKVLNRAGYDVTALDFPKHVLSAGDQTLLPAMADEVTEFAKGFARECSQPPLLIGVSIGGLMALNIVRRLPEYPEAILITGGDIAKSAPKFYKRAWRHSYEDLAEAWKDVNMYTDPTAVRSKRILFVMHRSSVLIDSDDVREEIAKQQRAGTDITLVERKMFGHIGTIFEETVLRPERLLDYISRVESKGDHRVEN